MLRTENELADYYFHQGTNTYAYAYMGVHRSGTEGDYLYVFRTFAYRAARIEVVGDFNGWRGTDMRRVTADGIWEAEIRSAVSLEGQKYKFRVYSAAGVHLKADPYARASEWGSRTASVVCTVCGYDWQDAAFLAGRHRYTAGMDGQNGYFSFPVNIYEVHLGSWRTREGRGTENGDAYLNYRELGDALADYCTDMGYTHVELMPIAEYPYDGSWGYQPTGWYAPTSRFGSPTDFMYLVDRLHRAGIGVILDWVAAHFPEDEHGLCAFDGFRLYEYQGDDRMRNKTWGTRYFDLGRNEVQTFLISNALFWMREYHIDGLRVDAVASMLYLDYDREPGEWTPAPDGTNHNPQAISFLQKLNRAVFADFPDAMMIAEESTAWPMVTKPTEAGGLGFNFKWNMGWVNDLFDYASADPFFRGGMHEKLTFSMYYAFSENFILPISHDENVHGKKSLLDKMSGDYRQKFDTDRLFLMYTMAHPGKKLFFMGTEFGQFAEWNYRCQLEWFLLDYPAHKALHDFVRILNHIYLDTPALWEQDFSWSGFSWIYADRARENLLAFRRFDRSGGELVALFNFSACPYPSFSLDVGTRFSAYRLLLCSGERRFGGTWEAGKTPVYPVLLREDGRECISLDLPPLSGMFFVPEGKSFHVTPLDL